MSSQHQETGLESLLTPDDCALLLIDHQPYTASTIESIDRQLLINNATALAKTAAAFDIPTVLTTVTADRGGRIFDGIQEVFPDQEPINRTTLNAWENEQVISAIEETGRDRLVVAGLWTEICLPSLRSALSGRATMSSS